MEAIIIVDLQRAFPMPPKQVARIERYSRRFRKRIFTRFENPAHSLFRTKLKQSCCAPGTQDTELWIAPGKGDLILTKRGYGLSPAAIRRIRKLGVTRLTVVGIDTDACVLGVMFSLFDAGLECRAKADLCWSSAGKRLHHAGMQIIRQQFPPPKEKKQRS